MKQLTKKLAMFTAAFALVATALFVPVVPVGATEGAATVPTTTDCKTVDFSNSTNTNIAQDGIGCGNTGGVPTTLFGPGSIFTTIVNVLLFIIGAISVIMLIWGGIRYTTSAGNSAAVTSAKNTIMYAIIGLVIAFLAFALVNWVLGAITPGAPDPNATTLIVQTLLS